MTRLNSDSTWFLILFSINNISNISIKELHLARSCDFQLAT
jgi:hypothetical protein